MNQDLVYGVVEFQEYKKRDGSNENKLDIQLNPQVHISISLFAKNGITYVHMNRTSNGKKYYMFLNWEEFQRLFGLSSAISDQLHLLVSKSISKVYKIMLNP